MQEIVLLTHDSKILERRLIYQTLRLSDIQLENGQYDECIIQERRYILINITSFQKKYGHTIDRGANCVNSTIGKMSCCNNGLGNLGVNIFI